MTLNITNPEGLPPEEREDEDIPFEQMANFAENDQDRCPIVLVVDVSASMRDNIQSLNDAIAKFRQTVLSDPVATLRVEVALVAFNHQVEILQDFVSIDEFDPGPLVAKGGTYICPAVNQALDMIEARKSDYRNNGVGYYRPWMFILTDGMTADVGNLSTTASRVRSIEQAKGVNTFAIMAGEAKHDDSRRQLQQMTDRVLPMREAAYDELLEWMANSTIALSNSNTGEQVKMEDLSTWLEVGT